MNRIKAILIHEVFISKHSFEIFNDILLYPLFSIIVFGFMTLYLTGSAGKLITDQVLAGMIFWQVVNIAQYSIGVGCLWDVWSRNLTNIFISPIRISEYLLSFGITGTIKSFIVLILAATLSLIAFDFNIFSMGLTNMFFVFINLVFFGFSF
ncbi:MAG: hypothetical protein AAB705_01835, partial [Patescibacteria group bacterium]